MTWFRLYTELLHDHKVQTLKPELFKAWINLLCLASANRKRGHLPPTKDIAYTLRVTEKKAALILDDLFGVGLLDTDPIGGSLRPHNWSGRQHEGDSSTERGRKFRGRKKAAVTTPTGVSSASYGEYLASAHWQQRRLRSLEDADWRCEVCKAPEGLDVHHNTYERLGEEIDSDLIVLCRPCHGLFHENGKLARPTD